jgi:hypothetical protein
MVERRGEQMGERRRAVRHRHYSNDLSQRQMGVRLLLVR